MRLDLGAFQTLDIESTDLGEQYTNSGDEPNTVIVVLTTAMDVKFVNRKVTALLTEEAQRKIIDALTRNLNGEEL